MSGALHRSIAAVVAVVLGGCGQSSVANEAPADADTAKPADDTRAESPEDSTVSFDLGDVPSVDTRLIPDGDPPPSERIGMPCLADGDCDKTGMHVAHCSSDAFDVGSSLPQPVCVGIDMPECAVDDGTSLVICAMEGLCVRAGTHERCLPGCSFDDSGAPPRACKGKDACTVVGWGYDASGRLQGAGVCFGGCTGDDDCLSVAGEKCQRETGLCVKTSNWVAFAKKPGEACHPAATGAIAECNCLAATATPGGGGYCANFCTVGTAGACDVGFSCTPSLPYVDPLDPARKFFTTNPRGIAGWCLKDCAVDADCDGLGAYCDTNVVGLASGKGVCQVGKKP